MAWPKPLYIKWLSLCNKLKLSNHLWNSIDILTYVKSNSLSLKYQRLTLSGFKEMVNRKCWLIPSDQQAKIGFTCFMFTIYNLTVVLIFHSLLVPLNIPKGIVSLISSDLPVTERHFWLRMEPLSTFYWS